MLFSSLAYIVLIVFTRIFEKLTRMPALALLISSCIFYLFAGMYDAIIFIFCVGTNWLICKFFLNPNQRLFISVAFNIGFLAAFKYVGLFFDNGVLPESYINAVLPLGISFYVFQILAYQIDVVRGESKEASSFASFLLFVSFFPQLIAGPIVRSKILLPQIERIFLGKRKRVRLISFGLAIFLLGLFKKIVLADSIGPFVDEIFMFGPENFAWAWLGGVLFAFQIYFDFSGYSDMAIGSAYLLGIKLPINFKTPYLSQGPREFWQLWHITLSSWIKDYLYIPLGGNKGSLMKAGITIIFTMAIAGLWHGANLTFMVWGALWGVYIFIARSLKLKNIPVSVAISINFLITVILWILFRSSDIEQAFDYYCIMFGLCSGVQSVATFHGQTGIFPVLITVAVIFYGLHILEYKLNSLQTIRVLKKWDGCFLWSIMSTLIVLIILLPKTVINPFIYFRF